MSKKILGVLVTAVVYTLTGCGTMPASVPASGTKSFSVRQAAKEELLVKFKAQVTTSSVGIFHAQHGTKTLRVIPGLNVHVMTITTGEPVTKVLAKVTKSPMVEYAEPNRSYNLNEE